MLAGYDQATTCTMTTDWLHAVTYIFKSALHSDLIESKDMLDVLSKESMTLQAVKIIITEKITGQSQSVFSR